MKWVAWNLFLAAIPAALAFLLAWGLRRRQQKKWFPLWLAAPIALVWLAFLPNSCYLLTEWRHFLFDRRWPEVLGASDVSGDIMLSTAKWALFFAAYSGAGVLLFVLAIRPLEKWLVSKGHRPFLYAPFFFFLMSLGVYLGLRIRLNTWDLASRPLVVWNTALDALTNRTLLWTMVFFAAVLWAIYEAVDLWVDGLVARVGGRRARIA